MAPLPSIVALTRSVVTVTCSVATVAAVVGAATGAVPGAAVVPGNAALGVGRPLAAGSVTGADADFATGEGPNSEGWPLCLFQASQISTSDIEKTTHSRVRRISVMERSGPELETAGA